MSSYKEIIDRIDKEEETFEGVVTKSERRLFDSAVSLVKDLEIEGGRIKISTKNLKLLNTIRTRLARAAKNKPYMEGVRDLVNAFDDIYKSQVDYYTSHFSVKTLKDNYKDKYKAMQMVAVNNTIDGLAGAGVVTNVCDPLNKMLLKAVTSGAKYSDLINELHNQLISSDERTSSFARYAKTYATTALTQYAGENNRLFTDDLGLEWFRYVGSTIETTRQFCELLTEKEYIHKSEIPEILKGRIEIGGKVHICEMNPKSGLPRGLMDGTTPENFQVNVGGWNCRHQLVPVAKEAVPKAIRDRLNTSKEDVKKAKEREEALRKKKEAEAKAAKEREIIAVAKILLKKASLYTEIDSSALSRAITNKDFNKIKAESTFITSKIEQVKADDKALSEIIPNVRAWKSQFSSEDLHKVFDAVQKKLNGLSTDLEKRKKSLEFEIGWVEEHKKYVTWEVAQDAYKKALLSIKDDVQIIEIKRSLETAFTYDRTSTDEGLHTLVKDMKTALETKGTSMSVLRAKAEKVIEKRKQLLKDSMKLAEEPDSEKVQSATLQELKEKLGDKFPKSLSGLDGAIERYEKTGRYGEVAKEHKAEIEVVMQKIFDIHDYGMNVDDSLLDEILSSHFKNTFEVGRSHGYLGSSRTTGPINESHSRLQASHKMFGISKEYDADHQLQRSDYEKYGNLLDHNIKRSITHNTATQYGNVEVRFKKSKVFPTWTAGDSLGMDYQPSLCSDPKSCSFDNLYCTPTSTDVNVKSLVAFKREHISSYLELQYHGKLTIDCVESLTFPYDLQTSKYIDIANKWKQKGVKVYYLAEDELLEL